MSQLDALTIKPKQLNFIEASAGTGKTTTLTNLYVRLLVEQDLTPAQILMVTFTNAATAELKTGVRKRMQSVLTGLTQNHFDDPLISTLLTTNTKEQILDKVSQGLKNFDEAAIHTIHGFSQRLLSELAFEIGVPFSINLSANNQALAEQCLQDIWRKAIRLLTPEQARLVAHKGISPSTLWEKCAAVAERAQLHFDLPNVNLQPNTVKNSWEIASKIWRNEGDAWLTDLEKSPALDGRKITKTKWSRWRKSLNQYFADFHGCLVENPGISGLSTEQLSLSTKKNHETPTHPLSIEFEKLHQQMIEAQAWLLAYEIDIISQWHSLYNEQKRVLRQASFNDALHWLLQAMSSAQGHTLIKLIQARFALVMVDEFQDTDPIQFALFQMLFLAPDYPGALFLVGDPKQAIYEFRGADLNTYLKARNLCNSLTINQAGKSEPNHDGTHHVIGQLTINYRASSNLVEAINALFKHPNPFANPQLNYTEVKASEKKRGHWVLPDTSTAANLVWLNDNTKNDGIPQVISLKKANQLAVTDCSQRIATLLSASAQGHAYFEENDPVNTRKPLKPSDIAVLVQKHAQAQAIADALTLLGVPSVIKTKLSIWQSDTAKSLHAIWLAYANPNKESLLRFALSQPMMGTTASQMLTMNDEDWRQELDQSQEIHRLWLKQGFNTAFLYWLHIRGIPVHLLAHHGGERQLTNLLHLGELLQIKSPTTDGFTSLMQWFERQIHDVSQEEEAVLRLESDAMRVQIVTIHSSKGLQYPLVFVPFMWNKIDFTQQNSMHYQGLTTHVQWGKPAHEEKDAATLPRFEEDLRIGYVAITRAQDHLWVSIAPLGKKTIKGELTGMTPSVLSYWLLGAHMSHTDPRAIFEATANFSPSEIKNTVKQWVAHSPGWSLTHGLTTGHVRLSLNQKEPLVDAKTLKRHINISWRNTSFTGLTVGYHDRLMDRDGALDSAASYSTSFLTMPQETMQLSNSVDASFDSSNEKNDTTIVSFPRGAIAGTALHAVLEDWAMGKNWRKKLPSQLQKYNLSEHWAPMLADHIDLILNTAMQPSTWNLSQVKPQNRQAEMGFVFAFQHLNWPAWLKALSDPEYGVPLAFIEAAHRLQPEKIQGFMSGFIDLIVHHEAHWYVLDYKSNWLGATLTDYKESALIQSMADHHYYLQALVYWVALWRFICSRQLPYDAIHIGHVRYLFIRGMPSMGVYSWQIPMPLIERISLLLMGSPKRESAYSEVGHHATTFNKE